MIKKLVISFVVACIVMIGVSDNPLDMARFILGVIAAICGSIAGMFLIAVAFEKVSKSYFKGDKK